MELDKNDSLLLNIYMKTGSKYFQKHFFFKGYFGTDEQNVYLTGLELTL